jgi:peptidoglycan hydrolase CwlO-like protein
MNEQKHGNKLNSLENFSIKLTESIGTSKSVLIHSFLFIGIFSLRFIGFDTDKILLILTTAVSLEAIYLSIFIQMTINRNTESLKEVEKDVDEIQEDVDEIQEDVDEIQKDVDEIQKDVDEIQGDVDEIQEDVEGIEDEVVDMSKDIDNIQAEDDKEDKYAIEHVAQTQKMISKIEAQMQIIISELNSLKTKEK